MDELVRGTGLGKATVYRLFPTKDALVGAYLDRLAESILAEVDTHHRHARSARRAVRHPYDAVQADIIDQTFRGCPFNNASIEYDNPHHPARVVARTTGLRCMNGWPSSPAGCCRGPRGARPSWPASWRC